MYVDDHPSPEILQEGLQNFCFGEKLWNINKIA